MVNQPNLLDIFSTWKTRAIPPGIMADKYDGDVWQSFMSNGVESRYNIGLALNVDWF